jgi:biopolymer transport protein ExbD
MAFTGMSSNGGSRGKSRFRTSGGTLSEMNVVPLVDVVLVLLIIFMVTASAFEFGLQIEVPKVSQTRTTAEELPVVSIDRGSKTYLNERAVNINQLGKEIQARFPNDKKVYLKSDKEVTVEVYLQVVDALGRAKMDVNAVVTAANIPAKR